MVVILAVASGVTLQANGLESASAHRLGQDGGVLGIGDGIAQSVAEEEGHLLEALAGLKELQPKSRAVFVTAAQEHANYGPAVTRHRGRHGGRALGSAGEARARYRPLLRLRPGAREL